MNNRDVYGELKLSKDEQKSMRVCLYVVLVSFFLGFALCHLAHATETLEGTMVLCEKGHPMEDVGNVSGRVLTSYPAQWDETYICRICNTKRVVRKRGSIPETFDDYRLLK